MEESRKGQWEQKNFKNSTIKNNHNPSQDTNHFFKYNKKNQSNLHIIVIKKQQIL